MVPKYSSQAVVDWDDHRSYPPEHEALLSLVATDAQIVDRRSRPQATVLMLIGAQPGRIGGVYLEGVQDGE